MQRDSFVFYRSFYEAIESLPKSKQLDVYRAIAAYALNGEEPKISGVSLSIFKISRPTLDKNLKKYENGCKGAKSGFLGAQYGNRGGRRRNGDPPKTPQETPQKTPQKPPYNENENENINENEKIEGEYARALTRDGEDHTPPGFPQVAPAPVPDLGYPKTPQEVMDKATMAGIQGATIEEAEAFLDYYSSRGWLAAAGVRIINWQASFRNWIRIGKDKKAKGAKNEYFRGSNAGVRQPYIEGRFNVAGDGYEYSDLDRIFGKESDSAGTGEAGNAGAGARQ